MWINGRNRGISPDVVIQANNGDAYSQLDYAFYLQKRGKDKKAIKYLEYAEGNGSIIARQCLGLAYKQGKGVPKDTEKADEYYRQATVNADLILDGSYRNVLAEPRYGVVYEKFLKEAELGSAYAAFFLGNLDFVQYNYVICYSSKEETRNKHMEKVLQWFLIANYLDANNETFASKVDEVKKRLNDSEIAGAEKLRDHFIEDNLLQKGTV